MKVLHISFHQGCQNDIKYICEKLGIDLTFKEFDDGVTKTCAKYNIGRERAQRCWDLYKDYFNTFDAVITSDTAPISRVFLQNDFQKRLIIWVCNRFDYCDTASLDCDFPDEEYYNFIRSAKNRINTVIAGYTPFENYYAKYIRNCDIGDLTIKPIGMVSNIYKEFTETNKDNKSHQFFVPPYHNDTIMIKLNEKLNELGIPNYNGRYNGPLDLAGYKGIIHIPYAWSNLALFENWQLGLIYFIPTKRFFIELANERNFFWSPPYREEVLELSEWYNPNHTLLFVQFDSWEDLKEKVKTTNYEYKRKRIKRWLEIHEDDQLLQWKEALSL